MKASRVSCILCGWLFAACGPAAAPGPASHASLEPSAVVPARPHEVVVFAAASLQRPFTAIAAAYERAHPGAKVTLRCEGAAALLGALLAGDPADVIVLADSSVMSRVAGAALLAGGTAAPVARNRVAIAVAKGNPKQIRELADLARADLRVALGARSASIGRHARWVLSRRPVVVQPAVEVPTAAAVLAKIAAGEADAGIVYATSFAEAGDAVQRVELPDADNTPVLYSLALHRNAREPAGAAAFRAFVLGPDGQRELLAAGFLPPDAK